MATTRRAVIDVGTNSVKVLVADVTGRDVRPVFEAGTQTRLGAGFYATHRLQADAIVRTAGAVAEYAGLSRTRGADSLRVFATSAAREAVNAEELVAAVEQAGGCRLEIISGEDEALWAFRGVQTHPDLAREPLLLVEVGGGSAQFILGQSEAVHFRESFALGAVRLMARCPHSDPPKPAELEACRRELARFLEERVGPRLRPALEREVRLHQARHAARLVGVGGTATVLARMEQGMDDYDRERIESAALRREQIEARVEQLWLLPLAARRQLRGLPPERADVILTGAAIYAAILGALGFSELRVSTRGLRFAAVMDAA